ncbi:dynein regulatory complex protein 9-like isoform X2 [Sitophilus oryzae]|uniref:Dynein regulatory complex protein 9-like isoform X2 n=1 Tax=Sitophilus oryzae TaxID=7048 RepID=A0A6J2Y069_SITOR|nr:dynein regulatory complex protein 9-like isoform X2 [Sitophilus oryzae]
MPCHIECATCHKKFFKISKMSQTNFVRNSMSKNQTVEKKKSVKSQDADKLLFEKEQLEQENQALRKEIVLLNTKNMDLVKRSAYTERKFVEDFANLQEQVKLNEKQLIESSKKCLEQQKSYAEEVKKLRQENDTLKKLHKKDELSILQRIGCLENEIEQLKLENETLKAQNEDNAEKTTKYKMKLKHAVKIVNELNQLVLQGCHKPEIMYGVVQTDNDKRTILESAQCGDTKNKEFVNSDELLLSDIFFKPKSFGGSELELFNGKSRSS